MAGRSPINNDILVQTRSDGTDSQARRYNGSSWVTVSLQINGDMVVDGTIGAQHLVATAIDGMTIRGTKIIGATYQSIGSNYMIVTSGTPFGPSNLIEWYGPKNGTTFNSTTQEAKLSGLTKVNAKSWKDDNGNVYTSGTIIAGTLTVSLQNPSITSSPSIDTQTFGSNGGQIAINCSFFASGGGLSFGSCPSPTPANPSVQLRLYDVVAGNTLVFSQTFQGTYSCSEEAGEHIESWVVNGSFTFYDNKNSTANRRYRLEATVNNMGDTDSQRLSILTQED